MWPNLRYYPGTSMKEMRYHRTSAKVTDLRTEIRTLTLTVRIRISTHHKVTINNMEDLRKCNVLVNEQIDRLRSSSRRIPYEYFVGPERYCSTYDTV